MAAGIADKWATRRRHSAYIYQARRAPPIAVEVNISSFPTIGDATPYRRRSTKPASFVDKPNNLFCRLAMPSRIDGRVARRAIIFDC